VKGVNEANDLGQFFTSQYGVYDEEAKTTVVVEIGTGNQGGKISLRRRTKTKYNIPTKEEPRSDSEPLRNREKIDRATTSKETNQ